MAEFRTIQPGDVVGGRYEIIKPLGHGGMAYVFLAHDLENDSEVALKVMRSELAGDPDFVRRFATEARAAASLDHPNIVRVLDYGQDGDVRYIIQEYIDGRTLKELIEAHGSLDYHLATPLAIQIALALEHAHHRDVIHRDIKPQNILITKDMVAKVTHFGIARAANANSITLTGGMVMGSVHYFSPEQARGSQITARSDLYSLGIVFYEMLTGRLPFDGESSVAIAIKHLQEMPIPPTSIKPNLPEALDAILNRMLAKNPDVRYANARELVNELDAFMVEPNGIYGVMPRVTGAYDHGTTAISVQKQPSNYHKIREIERTTTRRRSSRYRDTVIIIGIVAIALVLLSVIAFWLIQRFGAAGDVEMINLPNFVGRMKEDIRSDLDNLQMQGLKYTIRHEEKDDVEPDMVFEQNPVSDGVTTKIRADGHLLILVSLGPDTVKVPGVYNHTKASATSLFTAASLVPDFKEEAHDTIEEGHVIRTNPEIGEVVNKGGRVEVYISTGPDSIEMPDIEQRQLSVARGMLEQNKLRVGTIRYYSSAVAESQAFVIKQDIAKGTPLSANVAISLMVGTYQELQNYLSPPTVTPSDITMPNLAGTKGSLAKSSLEALGFVGRINFRPLHGGVTIQGVDAASIIINQEPLANTTISRSGSIVLYYGTRQDYEDYLNPPTPTPEPTPVPTPTPTVELPEPIPPTEVPGDGG